MRKKDMLVWSGLGFAAGNIGGKRQTRHRQRGDTLTGAPVAKFLAIHKQSKTLPVV
jgi:hypothetical protein